MEQLKAHPTTAQKSSALEKSDPDLAYDERMWPGPSPRSSSLLMSERRVRARLARDESASRYCRALVRPDALGDVVLLRVRR